MPSGKEPKIHPWRKSSEDSADMRIYFIGIAGAGMHSLALYLSEAGHEVMGSDPNASQEICDFWHKRGCRIYTSQRSENIQDVDLVVYSSAIPENNPERVEACRLGIACSRGAALARFANEHGHSISVCGTHGKGTTAAAISELLQLHGLRTSDILGAIPIGRNQPQRYVSNSEYLVCEVDESDRTHQLHRPKILVINNVEADHLNQYKDLKDIVQSFVELVKNCLKHGTQVVIHYAGVGAPILYENLVDFSEIHWVAPEGILDNPALAYRVSKPNQEGRCLLTLRDAGGNVVQFLPEIGGFANAQNLASASMVGRLLEIPMEEIAEHLSHYQGLKDRCQIQNIHGILLVTDYASHPTCVENDITWVRAKARRVVAIYHPYRYTLMEFHWLSLIKSLSLADKVYLLPFDPCGETAIEHISSPDMATRISENGVNAEAFDSFESCIQEAVNSLSQGDALIIFAGHPAFEMANEMLSKRGIYG